MNIGAVMGFLTGIGAVIGLWIGYKLSKRKKENGTRKNF